MNGEEIDSPVWNHLYSASTDLGLKGVGPLDWMEVLLLTMTMMLARARMMFVCLFVLDELDINITSWQGRQCRLPFHTSTLCHGSAA